MVMPVMVVPVTMESTTWYVALGGEGTSYASGPVGKGLPGPAQAAAVMAATAAAVAAMAARAGATAPAVVLGVLSFAFKFNLLVGSVTERLR
jgi:hypothetical protein